MQDTQWITVVLEWLGKVGIPGSMMAFIIWAVIRGVWVPGSMFRQMQKERDEARAVAADAVKVAERLTSGWRPMP